MTIKTTKVTGPEAIRALIMGLDMKSFVKLDVGEFMLLREGADFEGRKKLDYLMRRGEIEGFARGVVQEELAKAGLTRADHVPAVCPTRAKKD